MQARATVLGLVRERGVLRLRAALPRLWRLESLTSAAELVSSLDAKPLGTTVVLDPVMIRSDALDAVLGAVERRGGGLLVYAPSEIATIETVLGIASRLPAEIVLYGAIEEVAILMHRLAAMPLCSAPSLLLGRIAPALRALPASLARPFVALFGWRPLPDSINELLSGVQMHRRTAEHQTRKAGLHGIARLRIAAQLARAWEGLTESQGHFTQLVRQEGVSIRTLEDQFQRLVGVAPREARQQLTTRQFVDRLAASIAGRTP